MDAKQDAVVAEQDAGIAVCTLAAHSCDPRQTQ